MHLYKKGCICELQLPFNYFYSEMETSFHSHFKNYNNNNTKNAWCPWIKETFFFCQPIKGSDSFKGTWYEISNITCLYFSTFTKLAEQWLNRERSGGEEKRLQWEYVDEKTEQTGKCFIESVVSTESANSLRGRL